MKHLTDADLLKAAKEGADVEFLKALMKMPERKKVKKAPVFETKDDGKFYPFANLKSIVKK